MSPELVYLVMAMARAELVAPLINTVTTSLVNAVTLGIVHAPAMIDADFPS